MEQRKTSSFAFSKQILQLLFNQQAYAKDKVLWIGDSHAAFMRKGLKEKSIDGFRICSLVYWLGPRLMYSVSKSGFPSTLLFRSFVRFWKPRVIIVLLGEIDIRMFLHEPRLRDSSWVRDYLVKVDDIRKVLHSSQIFVLTSMPVSDLPPLDAIERKGTLVERLSGFSWMQEEIQNQIEMNQNLSNIKFLNLNNCLGDYLGCLKAEFTDDGIHVNSIGAHKCWVEMSSQF